MLLRKILSLVKRREAVEHVCSMFGFNRVSERQACCVIGRLRSTQRRTRCVPDDELRFVKRIEWLACDYGRYGYCKMTALLRPPNLNADPCGRVKP